MTRRGGAPSGAVAAVALLGALSSCDPGAPKREEPGPVAAEFPAAAPTPPRASPAPPASDDAARIRVVFDEPRDPRHRPIVELLFRSGRLRGLVEALNREVALPEGVVVRFGDVDGPLYDPRTREIAFDYGFVAETAEMLARVDYADKPGDLRAFVVQVVEFVLTHEVGHALVDLFELPLLGSEEDAVDAIATLLLLELVPDGNLVALTAADLHAIESLGRRDLGVGEYWGDHLLGLQRFARIVCLVYGSDAATHAPLLARHRGLADRRDECVEDYAAQRRAWKRLFGPHLRRPSGEGLNRTAPPRPR